MFALQSVPIVALAPLILAAFGFGFGAKTLVVFLSAVFPILINTVEGARHAPKTLLEVAKVHRSGEWPLWRDVLIPHTLPYAMSGIRAGHRDGVRRDVHRRVLPPGHRDRRAAAVGLGPVRLGDRAGLTVLVSVIAALLMGLGRRLEKAFAP